MRKVLLSAVIIGAMFAFNLSVSWGEEKGSLPPSSANQGKKPFKPSSQACPSPYMGISPDGRCGWSCSKGTRPDPKTWQCICQPDKDEVGKDRFGRRICQTINDKKL